MNQQDFDAVVRERCKKIEASLCSKQKEYAPGADKLHNFKMSAALRRCTPSQALLGMVTKHLVSLVDMIESDVEYPLALWEEKLGDAINYFVLQECIVKERLARSPTNVDPAGGHS